MAFLKFNKAELVNLEYSLRREILGSNSAGTYFNTSIIACNTRKYHGLLVVPVPAFGEEKYVLLSALDESIILGGKQFNLGIHCYGDTYEPKGHKYIIDFDADGVPVITYKVGPVTIAKSIAMAPDSNQVLISYKVLSSPGKLSLILKPFLAFRGIHSLTCENAGADTGYAPAENGAAFRMYGGFPTLYLQTSLKSVYGHQPYWYKGITYSDEYRRGFDCREDLLVPGSFTVDLHEGSELVVSASTSQVASRSIKGKFEGIRRSTTNVGSHRDILLNNAKSFKVISGGRKKIAAGYSWLETGLLRETISSLAGLTLYANADGAEFEEILDNLINAEGGRLYHRTTQIEAPLALTDTVQQYLAFGADEKKLWKKYGDVLKGIIESYESREEASICPNGLLWCQEDGVALTWMNSYVNGWPVNERAGFQVETNAMWYNALCFAIEMEGKYGAANSVFCAKWIPVRDLVKENYQKTFLITSRRGYHMLADYVDNYGQHAECRPNMLWAAYIPYSLVDPEVQSDIIATIDKELVTRRGIRTLSPRSVDYRGVYEGSQHERDLAYYNGCARPDLLGMWEDVCFRMIGPSFAGRAKWLTEGFFEDVNLHGVGSFSELYDGEPPHEAHGAISSACATASLMRCIYLMDKYSKEGCK
ncbi:MAG: glycogen debranching enzyme family protein [Bacteroidales bacterium]|nr:glycogen debranching enzyme family protein [Candidatus Hennigimonas equi]